MRRSFKFAKKKAAGEAFPSSPPPTVPSNGHGNLPQSGLSSRDLNRPGMDSSSNHLAAKNGDYTTHVINMPWSDDREGLHGKYCGPLRCDTLKPHGDGTLAVEIRGENLTFYGSWDNGELVSSLSPVPPQVRETRKSQTSNVSDHLHVETTSSSSRSSSVSSLGGKIETAHNSLSPRRATREDIKEDITRTINMADLLNRPYTLGEACRTPSDMIAYKSNKKAIESAALLEKWDQAFIRRSNGIWTVAVMIDKAMQPKDTKKRARWCTAWEIDPHSMDLEESLLFTVDSNGGTKIINRKSWGQNVRRMKGEATRPSNNDAVHIEDLNLSSDPEEVLENLRLEVLRGHTPSDELDRHLDSSVLTCTTVPLSPSSSSPDNVPTNDYAEKLLTGIREENSARGARDEKMLKEIRVLMARNQKLEEQNQALREMDFEPSYHEKHLRDLKARNEVLEAKLKKHLLNTAMAMDQRHSENTQQEIEHDSFEQERKHLETQRAKMEERHQKEVTRLKNKSRSYREKSIETIAKLTEVKAEVKHEREELASLRAWLLGHAGELEYKKQVLAREMNAARADDQSHNPDVIDALELALVTIDEVKMKFDMKMAREVEKAKHRRDEARERRRIFKGKLAGMNDSAIEDLVDLSYQPSSPVPEEHTEMLGGNNSSTEASEGTGEI